MNSDQNPGAPAHETPEHFEHHGHGRRCGPCGGRRLWFVPLILAAIAVKGAIFMWLWNHLIPDIFAGPELQYLQAVGLMILGKMLVGFHGGRHGGGWGGRRHRMKEKFWASMSEEERRKMRDHFRRRCDK